MQENEFEKRLRQEMEEFKLRPSDNVWEKVEEQLRKKKKRRVVFFIFMLAGLSLLGYSGYFLTKTNSRQSIVQQEDNSLPGNKKNESATKTQSAPTIKTVKTRDASSGENEQSRGIAEKSSAKEKADEDVSSETVTLDGQDIPTGHVEKSKSINSYKYGTAKSTRKNSPTTKDNGQPGKTVIIGSEKSSGYPPVKDDISQPSISKSNVQDDSTTIAQKGIAINKSDSVTANPESDALRAEKTKKQTFFSKIKWGVDLSIGKSSSRHNAFELFSTNKSADMLYSSPVSNSGGGGGFGPGVYPSDVKGGPAFHAGLIGEMKISKRSSISSGLQYAYHSNKIEVGLYADTTVMVNISFARASRVDAIYRGTHQKEFTNHYHFIQIPLQYQWQLNKGVKVPILWNMGVSAGYLLSTNGLVYDTTAGGIYYHDNAVFNKFQFNLLTGFSFRFGNNSKMQWSLGPEISMAMNKLMNDDYSKKQYLLYGGVTGRIFFNKRNNK